MILAGSSSSRGAYAASKGSVTLKVTDPFDEVCVNSGCIAKFLTAEGVKSADEKHMGNAGEARAGSGMTFRSTFGGSLNLGAAW